MQFFKFSQALIVLFFITGAILAQTGFVNPDIDQNVYRVELQPDGRIIIGGTFRNVGGQPRSRVARLNSDGTLDLTFQDPQISSSDQSDINAFAIALQNDGKIIVGGLFTTVSGQSRPNIVRLNADGSADATFAAEVNGAVTALAIQSDGKILAGGEFTTAGGQTRTRLARFNPDGSLDASFGNASVSSFTNSIVVQPDGKILIGGNFTSVGGAPRAWGTRLNVDGTLDAGFALVLNGPVSQFTRLIDGKIIVCGFFGVVNGSPRTTIARLNSDGTLDASLQNIAIPSGSVNAFGVQSDRKIVVGGNFSTIAGVERRELARLNSDGTFDASFLDVNANFGGSFSTIDAVVIQPDSRILIGGSFNMVGRQTRKNTVRLISNGTLDLPPAQTLTVTKTTDTNDGLCNTDCSLREALAAANASPGASAINFSAPLFTSPQTITLTDELVIEDNHRMSISGPGSDLLTISGNNSTRILRIKRDALVDITGLKMTGGNGAGGSSSGEGGALYIEANGVATQVSLVNLVIADCVGTTGGAIRGNGTSALTISGTTITGNRATGSGGGGIFFGGGSLSITNSSITNNEVTFQNGAGGGVSVGNAVLTVFNSGISNNRANFSGGLSIGGTATIQTSIISQNRAASLGGGLGGGANVTLINTNVSFNTATAASGNGGGIYNNGRLTLTESSVFNNTAAFGGGVYTAGGFTSTRSTISQNTATTSGGAVYNNSGGTSGLPVNIKETLIRDNTAMGFGGGIYNRDNLVLDGSNIINNFAPMGGGGAFNVFLNVGAAAMAVSNSTFSANRTNASGAGIANQAGTVTVTNSTVSGNEARGLGGGIHTNTGGTVNLNHATVAFNVSNAAGGGGLNNNGATINLRNTIVARNQAGSPATSSDIGGAIISGGYNLIESVGTGTIAGTTTGNILGLNPRLGPLGVNGGGTLSHLLLGTSPAIDAADTVNGLAVDQRGGPRPADGDGDGAARPDIGSVEIRPVFVTNLSDAGTGSLRQAIVQASLSGDVISFSGSIFTTARTIVLTTGELVVPDNAIFTIGGAGSELLTIDGNGQSRVFSVASRAGLTLTGMTITGGNGSGVVNNGNGGAIDNFGELTLSDVVVRNNFATGNGGGISGNLNARLTISNSTIRDNAVTGSGGGLFNEGSVDAVNSSTISGNIAGTAGGGIAVGSGSLAITNSTISGNRSTSGGGVSNSGQFGHLTIVNSTVCFNAASPGTGGGVDSAAPASTGAFNTIFAKNSGLAPDFSGELVSQGFNLIENQSGLNIIGETTGNILGQDPLLDPRLRSNGGPTFTHALRIGSPAIDAGSGPVFGSPATDQRGQLRPYNFPSVPNPPSGNGSDIGAFERQAIDVSGLPFVTVSGRVQTPAGAGLRNAVVALIDSQGVKVTATTSSFGVFNFVGVRNDESYTITVASKRYRFAPLVLSIQNNLANIDFTGLE